jgi:hypothetical protein
MNEKLQRQLSAIENCIKIQKDCIINGTPEMPYMHGMANGLIVAHAIVAELHEPKFVSRPRRPYGRNIRHKCCRSKRNR